MDNLDEVAKLEEACRLVWEEYERLMERMHTAANVEEIPIEELQRCTRDVKAALSLYLFLKRREGKIKARLNTLEVSASMKPYRPDPSPVLPPHSPVV